MISPEFRRDALEALRQLLEDSILTLARGAASRRSNAFRP